MNIATLKPHLTGFLHSEHSSMTLPCFTYWPSLLHTKMQISILVRFLWRSLLYFGYLGSQLYLMNHELVFIVTTMIWGVKQVPLSSRKQWLWTFNSSLLSRTGISPGRLPELGGQNCGYRWVLTTNIIYPSSDLWWVLSWLSFHIFTLTYCLCYRL